MHGAHRRNARTLGRLALVLCLVAVSILSGCTEEQHSTKEKPVSSSVPSLRIVSLAPNVTEILFALGAGRLVVGNTKFCNYPEAAVNTAKIGGVINPDLESIMVLQPDLVIGVRATGQEKSAARLRGLGVDVLIVAVDNLDDVFTATRAIGKKIGRADRAELLVNYLQSRISSISSRVRNLQKPKVLFVIGHDPIYLASGDTFIGELINLAGGENIAADAKTLYPKYSMEEVVLQGPDVIIDATMGSAFSEADSEKRGDAWANWEELPAVKNGRVYGLDTDILMRPGPRVVEGLDMVLQAIHPESAGQGRPKAAVRAQVPGNATKLSLFTIVAATLAAIAILAVLVLRGSRLRWAGIITSLALLLVVVAFVCVLIGAADVDMLRALDTSESFNIHRTILFDLRIPRVLLAIIVGSALAVSGVTFQALLRNPLADPYILGISGGAALGAAISIVFEMSWLKSLGHFSTIICAFIGALVTIFTVYRVATVRGRIPRHTLLLVGVIVNAFFGAAIMFFTSVVDFSKANRIVVWLMGSLGTESYGAIIPVALIALAGTAYLFSLVRKFDLLALGDESAAQLGVDVEGLKRRAFIAASLVTAAVVSVSGPIGFVGLIVPHMMRLICGPAHRLLLPASFLAGGVFLVAADTLARTLIAPEQIPVGVITVFCGGPFFILLLKKRQSDL
ncbi:iron chelate uptake ABC transporter family permease subunit [Candidatus Hydrogenedentota bacterium]